MLREAAALTTQVDRRGDPLRRARACSPWRVRQPAGVVLGIAPWNAPVILGVRAIAMPLACGNTVVLKASELCPRTHAADRRGAARSRPAARRRQRVVTRGRRGAAEVVEALIAHPAVRRVNFTGSTRVGRIVARDAARHLKPCCSSWAARRRWSCSTTPTSTRRSNAASFGAFMHQGQICMSTERIVVDRKVADEFVGQARPSAPRRCRSAIRAKGDAARLAGQPGRASSASRADRRRRGARAPTCSPAARSTAPCFAPPCSTASTPEMRIYREESFGPVVSSCRVDDVDEAVRIANDTEYGLSAAVFGARRRRARSTSRAGSSPASATSTAPTVHDEAQMPFGGVKASGLRPLRRQGRRSTSSPSCAGSPSRRASRASGCARERWSGPLACVRDAPTGARWWSRPWR